MMTSYHRERVTKENTQLLLEISNICHREDRSDVNNILLLGSSGAGKSALLNTIIKVIAGQYIHRVPVGKGISFSKTLCLHRYDNCGVSRGDIVEERKSAVIKFLYRLPTIIDMAGLGNVCDPSMEEILEVLIGGCVQPGTTIEFLQKKQTDNYVGALRKIFYTKSNPKWKVNKIVFVQGGHDAVPDNLITCLQSVLNKVDESTGVAKYTQDVSVVVTKYDLVSGLSQFPSKTRSTTQKDFEDTVTLLAKKFDITGALEYNLFKWASYSDNIGFNNPHVDNTALKFLKRMVTPGVRQPEALEQVITTSNKFRALLNKISVKKDHLVLMMFLAVFVLILGILISHKADNTATNSSGKN